MTSINGDAGTEQMSAALKDAAGDLELITNRNTQTISTFEGAGWVGLDVLTGATGRINRVRENLIDVADKIGVGGQIVRDAHLNNHMIGHATKASLGHT